MSNTRKSSLLLYDMASAVDKIVVYTQNLTLDDLFTNELVKDAILRNIQVLGDAAKTLPPDLIDSCPEIDWKGITGLRDIITHQYFRVDWAIIWATIQVDFPSLSISLHRLLETSSRG